MSPRRKTPGTVTEPDLQTETPVSAEPPVPIQSGSEDDETTTTDGMPATRTEDQPQPAERPDDGKIAHHASATDHPDDWKVVARHPSEVRNPTAYRALITPLGDDAPRLLIYAENKKKCACYMWLIKNCDWTRLFSLGVGVNHPDLLNARDATPVRLGFEVMRSGRGASVVLDATIIITRADSGEHVRVSMGRRSDINFEVATRFLSWGWGTASYVNGPGA